MIATGNFSNLEKYKKAGYIPVSIARYPIKNYTGVTFTKLAPTHDMLSMNEDDYRKKYTQILSRIDKMDVLNELNKLGSKIVLLCYEREGEFCHRKLVAEWLFEVAGEIIELGNMQRKQKYTQTQEELCFSEPPPK